MSSPHPVPSPSNPFHPYPTALHALIDLIGGHRSIQIRDWVPHPKNTLVGFFSATPPSGMVLHSLTLHQKGDARWVSFPAREWTTQEGQKQFARIVEFTDRRTADKFRDQVLEALDRHLEELP